MSGGFSLLVQTLEKLQYAGKEGKCMKMKDENKNYEELTFTDDFMFCKVLENNLEICKELLEMILGVKIRKIVCTSKQKVIEITSDGKGIRLDVYLEDDDSTVYDIEMQTTEQRDISKRSRYYQGMIDLNLIERGARYGDLKKSYVIFICLHDPFKKGLHLYYFANTCKGHPELQLEDEAYKVFVSAEGDADDVSDNMKAFLKYLCGETVDNRLVKEIDVQVQKAREQVEWREEYMTLLMRDQEKKEEGAKLHAIEMAKIMLSQNEPIEKISMYTQLPEEEIISIQKEEDNNE